MNRILIACLLSLSLFPQLVRADNKIALLDQVVEIEKDFSSPVFLIESGLGSVDRYEAVYVAAGQPEEDVGLGRLHFGAIVPLGSIDLVQHYTLLLHADNSILSSPVSLWSNSKKQSNLLLPQLLQEKMKDDMLSMGSVENNIYEQEKELERFRKKVTGVVETGDLLRLSQEIERIKSSSEFKKSISEKLAPVVDGGYNDESNIELTDNAKALAIQLKQAAQTTAMADRLSQQKQKAESAQIEQKARLVKELATYDSAALAKEVLRLRVKRKALEQEVYGPSYTDQDEF